MMIRSLTSLALVALFSLSLGCGGSGGATEDQIARICTIVEECFGAGAASACTQDFEVDGEGSCDPSNAEIEACVTALEGAAECDDLEQIAEAECPCQGDDPDPDPEGNSCTDLAICCGTIATNPDNQVLAIECSQDLFDAMANKSVCQAALDDTYGVLCGGL